MVDEIIYGVQQEINALFLDTGCTVILKADFKANSWPTYKMPLVLIDVEEGDDTMQLLGGVTMMDWSFDLSAYNYMPDITGLDPTPYSAERTEIADKLRRHFSNFANWVTPEMIQAYTDYKVRWTLSRVGKADQLEHPDGLCKGFKFGFSTISLDYETAGSVPGPGLNDINQVDLPPAH